jgi:hypothetical protein
MTVEELAWEMLRVADQHRNDAGGFDDLDAAMAHLKDEPNFPAALARTVQILDEHFPSTEVH